jgi:hypothetical protein
MQIIASAAHPRYHTLAEDEFFAKRSYNWVKWGGKQLAGWGVAHIDIFGPALKDFAKTEGGKIAISKEFYADFPGSSGVIFIVRKEPTDETEILGRLK